MLLNMRHLVLISLLARIVAAVVLTAPLSLEERKMHPDLPKTKAVNPDETNAAYWFDKAQDSIKTKISQKLNQNHAKNVILFLGDGMSVPTVSAARVTVGGEEVALAFDSFPYTGLSKTYGVDIQVSDSANTATAYLCGVKANYATIGVTAKVERQDCDAMLDEANHVFSIAHYSQQLNKKTGIVTTARVTHASPAGVYAHTSYREWESDTDVAGFGQDPAKCTDIATQLILGDTGKNFDVIMGGGRAKFFPSGITDETGAKGSRSDGVNLIEEWLKEKDESSAAYVWNKDQLLGIPDSVEHLLGLFASDHCSYNLDRDPEQEPSLAEMTEAAIQVLSKGQNGFFLFVEGAKIDMAHHDTKARKAMDEVSEFSKAIQRAVDLTNDEDTLIVVTADHAHSMTFNGYAERGHDIFEFAGLGEDELVYATLSYANGPGYRDPESDGSRHDLTTDDMTDKDYKFPAMVPIGSETHGGDDVAIYARGPWSHLFTGVHEQSAIPHFMAFASCVGVGDTVCKLEERTGGGTMRGSPLNVSLLAAISVLGLLLNHFCLL